MQPCNQNNFLNSIKSLRCDVFDTVTIMPQVSVGITDKVPHALFACGAFCDDLPIPQAHGLPGMGRLNVQLPKITPKKFFNREVIFGGEFLGYWGHWGHFLVETLQRLWYTKHKDLPIAWTVHEKEHCDPVSFFKENHADVFKNLGINNEHIFIAEPTQFRRVHFPEPGLSIAGYAHPEHLNFLGYYQGEIEKGKYVYFSRSRYNNCTNEKVLEEVLKKFGWEVVFPEDLPTAKQLELLTSAEVCMMISGSAQHSLLLTRNSKTRFIVIPRIHSDIYNSIAHAKSNNYFLLNVGKEISSAGMHDNEIKFTIHIDEFTGILERTQNFTNNLEDFPRIFQPPPKPAEENFQIPNAYYEKDCSVTTVEKYFYEALFFYREQKYAEAFKILMYLYNEKLLEFYMYDYFFIIIEKYDAHFSVKTELSYDKNQFLLERAKKSITFNPSNCENYTRLAEQLQRMGRSQEAIKILNDTINKFPKWALPYANLAAIYITQNNISLATSYAQKAFRLDPMDSTIKQILAGCLYMNQ